jgi:glycosyltransferase involved in cell wall biosynthesis
MAGQQQRVRYKLRALRPSFEITALTFALPGKEEESRQRWLEHADEVMVLPSITQPGPVGHAVHKAAAVMYELATGLKQTNFKLGRREFSPKRVAAATAQLQPDLVLYEYWHAHRSAAVFRERGIPTILDMHDVLWQSLARQLGEGNSRRVERYRQQEEAAWKDFDAIIAINAAERDYVRSVHPGARLFLAEMGTDIARWPYRRHVSTPPRIGFYGSLSSKVNRDGVRRCAARVMPMVWARYPETEFWIVGANPPEEIRALARDGRIHVTGRLDDPADALGGLVAVLCPWEGTYGFRSRLIEVMSTGVPVVASPDAVYGMRMEEGQGLLLAPSDAVMAAHACALLDNASYAEEQSRRARRQASERYSFEATYGKLAGDVLSLLRHDDGRAT